MWNDCCICVSLCPPNPKVVAHLLYVYLYFYYSLFPRSLSLPPLYLSSPHLSPQSSLWLHLLYISIQRVSISCSVWSSTLLYCHSVSSVQASPCTEVPLYQISHLPIVLARSVDGITSYIYKYMYLYSCTYVCIIYIYMYTCACTTTSVHSKTITKTAFYCIKVWREVDTIWNVMMSKTYCICISSQNKETTLYTIYPWRPIHIQYTFVCI